MRRWRAPFGFTQPSARNDRSTRPVGFLMCEGHLICWFGSTTACEDGRAGEGRARISPAADEPQACQLPLRKLSSEPASCDVDRAVPGPGPLADVVGQQLRELLAVAKAPLFRYQRTKRRARRSAPVGASGRAPFRPQPREPDLDDTLLACEMLLQGRSAGGGQLVRPTPASLGRASIRPRPRAG